MIDIERYKSDAKQIIKDRFGVEIEVDFVKNVDIEKRVAEVAEQYGGSTHGFGGLFTPGANGYPPLIVVGYDESEPFGCVEVYYHELQHAIDHYEVMQSMGKDGIEPYRKYYVYFTEYNASYQGILRQTRAVLDSISPQDRHQYITDAKEHAKTVFLKWEIRDIIDVLHYLARLVVFSQIEGRQDDTMLAVVPQVSKFIELINFTNRYQPTGEWYEVFKKLIDGLTVKEKQ